MAQILQLLTQWKKGKEAEAEKSPRAGGAVYLELAG